MKSISPLSFVHQKGKFGDHDNIKEKDLLKISEVKDVSIFQIVKFKNFKIQNKIEIDNLSLPSSLKSSSNSNTRILWLGPNNWLVISTILDLMITEKKKFDDQDFAITDLSYSRTIIELEGKQTDEVLKKGCPLNINEFKKGDCANSVYNGIAITIDFISDDPKKVRIFGLRSFGESLYHSITDSSLEYGYLGN